MNPEEIVKTIQTRYSYLPPVCFEELFRALSIRPVSRNEILVREGQYAKSVYFIISGAARAYYYIDGKDVSDWFAFSNEFICPIVSFFSDKPSAHYIEVLEDSLVAEVTQFSVNSLSEKYPEFERLIRTIVTEVMLRQQQRISSILFYTAKQKYAHLVKEYPTITEQVPLKHIASHLGMTVETLSRVRSSQT